MAERLLIVSRVMHLIRSSSAPGRSLFRIPDTVTEAVPHHILLFANWASFYTLGLETRALRILGDLPSATLAFL
jgi:hypothetical protein